MTFVGDLVGDSVVEGRWFQPPTAHDALALWRREKDSVTGFGEAVGKALGLFERVLNEVAIMVQLSK